MSDPEADAMRVLKSTWSSGSDDIPLPVDPVQIARTLGIDVLVAAMNPEISGALIAKPGTDPAIYLSQSDSRNRQRFTCAHELGHYTARVNADTLQFEFVDKRDEMAKTGGDADEVYANQFAAALLMPADMVRKLHKQGLGAVEMAARFSVSAEAMSYRLTNLRLR